eukprot:4197851-Pyramimonas_sp.AAC.1
MMTKHLSSRKQIWRDLLELSLIFPITPTQCPPKNPWRPLRGPRRPDGLPRVAGPPKMDGCVETCEILLTDREHWGEPGTRCGTCCVGSKGHEGLHACMCHIGVTAGAGASRQPRARARSPH